MYPRERRGAGSHIQLNSMNVSGQGLMETLAGSFNNPLEWLDKVVVTVKWGGCDFIGLHQVCHCNTVPSSSPPSADERGQCQQLD